ncbi:MAG: BlaB/IND/MUS family subclass B1 metallo-beta-lactamase [Taibaiella sp.]|jgi:glyoxylase-like metal-dependent hydrolase (beta-lactamase superfamily II)
MKTNLFLILLLACIAPYSVFAQKERAHSLTISKLTGDYYVYTTYGTLDDGSTFPSNSLYVVTQKGVVMVDVPWDTTQTLPLLDSIEKRHHKKVIACISTHFHADRTAGLDILKSRGVKTYATTQTLQLCKERNEQLAEYGISADTVFNFGDHILQTYYPGKGHTSDNIVVWFPKAKVLYGGCFVKSIESKDLGNLADANAKEWAGSIKNVKAKFKNIAYIIPGHGGWKSKQALDHTLSLVRTYNEKEQ